MRALVSFTHCILYLAQIISLQSKGHYEKISDYSLEKNIEFKILFKAKASLKGKECK
jgi:hypothetical protein